MVAAERRWCARLNSYEKRMEDAGWFDSEQGLKDQKTALPYHPCPPCQMLFSKVQDRCVQLVQSREYISYMYLSTLLVEQRYIFDCHIFGSI